jgi:hypothetical protein
LKGDYSVLEVAENVEISIPQLYAWACTPEAQMRFEMIRQLSKLRDELIQLDGVTRARETLINLAVFTSATESAASRESRRKAAMALLPQHNRRAPRSSKAAPTPIPPRTLDSPDSAGTTPPPSSRATPASVPHSSAVQSACEAPAHQSDGDVSLAPVRPAVMSPARSPHSTAPPTADTHRSEGAMPRSQHAAPTTPP